MTNKPEVVAWLHSIRQDSDVITSRVRNVWGTPRGSMGEYTVALIRLTDHEADRAADKARIAELTEVLRNARDMVADWGAYASEYFREKHSLAGDLARIDAALSQPKEDA